MIKLSDYVARFLVEHQVKRVFMVTGGGAMHLNDSLGNAPGMTPVFNHHEQACAIAAEGAARVTGELQVVLVTTGPGGLNTLTGVMGQWTDSVPVLYLSGQVKWETMLQSCPDVPLRQLGDQEVDIVSVVRPLVKYAKTVTDPLDIKATLEEALHRALSGRHGPVWVNVPMNVQGAPIDETKLRSCAPPRPTPGNAARRGAEASLDLLGTAQRPVIVAGRGVRIAGAQAVLDELATRLSIPVLTTLNGFDLLPTTHPCWIGRIGSQGTRAGNFAVQNADLVITVGTRNNVRQVSYNWPCFARAAKKVVVDIDEAELKKPILVPDVPVCADAGDFLRELSAAEKQRAPGKTFGAWLEWCAVRRERYPVALPEYEKADGVHPYWFAHVLSKCLRENEIIVTANGTANVAYFQAGAVKKGQVAVWNSGCAAMGYDLPAAIGACFGAGKRDVICLAGDGSLQMNVQELATVAFHQLPIKIFLFNNHGYASIRQTQRNFFGRFVGCDPESGLSGPDLGKVAEAYGVPATRITSSQGLEQAILTCLARPGPLLVDVVMTREYTFSPKTSSERKPDGRMVSKPLEDMAPFLPRDEFASNMLIPEWPET